jgi:hypothetical protein
MYTLKHQLSGLFFVFGSILSSASNATLTIEDDLICEIIGSELHLTMELSQDTNADDQLNAYIMLPRGGWGSVYVRRFISQDIPLTEIQSLKLPVPIEWEISEKKIPQITVAVAIRSLSKQDKLSISAKTQCVLPKEE